MITTSARPQRIMLGMLAWAGFGLLECGVARAQQASPAPANTEKPSATAGPTNNVRPAIKWKRFDYTCEAGAKLTVYLHDGSAKVRTHDHIYMMRQSRSADGDRYSDGKVLWWSKGDAGFLQEDTPDGDGGMLEKGCILDKPAEASKP